MYSAWLSWWWDAQAGWCHMSGMCWMQQAAYFRGRSRPSHAAVTGSGFKQEARWDLQLQTFVLFHFKHQPKLTCLRGGSIADFKSSTITLNKVLVIFYSRGFFSAWRYIHFSCFLRWFFFPVSFLSPSGAAASSFWPWLWSRRLHSLMISFRSLNLFHLPSDDCCSLFCFVCSFSQLWDFCFVLTKGEAVCEEAQCSGCCSRCNIH